MDQVKRKNSLLIKILFPILFLPATFVTSKAQVVNYIDSVPPNNYSQYEQVIEKSREILELIKCNKFEDFVSLYDLESGIYSYESLKDNFEWFRTIVRQGHRAQIVITLSKQQNVHTQAMLLKSVNVYFLYPSNFKDIYDKFGVKHYEERIEFEFNKSNNQRNVLDKLEQINPR